MKVFDGADLPILNEPQCSVIHAECLTGKILLLDGKRRDIRSQAAYILMFVNLAAAENYAEEKTTESPDIECHIIDHNGQQIKRFAKKRLKQAVLKTNKKWWQIWR